MGRWGVNYKTGFDLPDLKLVKISIQKYNKLIFKIKIQTFDLGIKQLLKLGYGWFRRSEKGEPGTVKGVRITI